MKKEITSNILADISRKLKGESYSEDISKNALVVFNGSNIDLDQRINYIKELKKDGMKISLAFSFMAEQILDMEKIIRVLDPINVYREEDVFKLKDITKNYALIIGPNITMNTLSKVALGMVDSFISTMVWTFLYQGKKTYLDFNSVRNYLGEETKNMAISNMAENYIKQILQMGAIEISQKDYSKEGITENVKTANSMVENKQEKKVITENDIRNLRNNENLILPIGSIVTPLAKDKAREMNIKIEIRKAPIDH